jgi:hypothetical protein
MNHTIGPVLHWSPRLLGFLFAAFLSVFALDELGEPGPAWRSIVLFLIHLIPSALVLAALALAWRWERAGGIAFLALGAGYLALASGRFPWLNQVILSGPLLLAGVLFEIDAWYARGRKG